jgi:hypothetical protein
MRIKIIIAHENKVYGDMGIFYIESQNKEFIDIVSSITDEAIMVDFLESNQKYYTEHLRAFKNADKTLDLSKSMIEKMQDTQNLESKFFAKGYTVVSPMMS